MKNYVQKSVEEELYFYRNTKDFSVKNSGLDKKIIHYNWGLPPYFQQY